MKALLILSVLLMLLSLLTLFKAPVGVLWIPALFAAEWGHYLALASVLLAIVVSRFPGSGRIGFVLALIAAVLFMTPVLRAIPIAQKLPEECRQAFGSVTPIGTPGAAPRPGPLSFLDLYRGVKSPSVRISRYLYSSNHGQDLNMDVYAPEQPTAPLPVVITIHGGSWKSGDNSELSALNHYLAARGYLVAAVNYRLAPRWTFPAARDDVFEAIAYLKSHARELNLDPRRIAIIGRSAGGQIALATAYARQDPSIRGVVAFYAPNDLIFGYSVPDSPLIMDSNKLIEDYLGGTPTQLESVYEAASPIRLVGKTTPPTLMIHGQLDNMVWPVHEDRLSKRLAEAGRPHLYLRLPWATHGCDANFSGPSGQLSTYAIERFLAAVMQERG